MYTKLLAILLIEDDPAHAQLIHRAFEYQSNPANLVVAYTLQEAYASLADTIPDLAITDLHLPDGKGTELLLEKPGKLLYTTKL